MLTLSSEFICCERRQAPVFDLCIATAPLRTCSTHLLFPGSFMGRSRADKERTRAANAANRHRRMSAGKLLASLDWKCKHCSRWFSKKRSAPANHMRRCKGTQAFLRQAAKPRSSLDSTGGSTRSTTLESSNSGSVESSSASDSESTEDSTDSGHEGFARERTRRAKACQPVNDCADDGMLIT
jgi:hypothetical protein